MKQLGSVWNISEIVWSCWTLGRLFYPQLGKIQNTMSLYHQEMTTLQPSTGVSINSATLMKGKSLPVCASQLNSKHRVNVNIGKLAKTMLTISIGDNSWSPKYQREVIKRTSVAIHHKKLKFPCFKFLKHKQWNFTCIFVCVFYVSVGYQLEFQMWRVITTDTCLEYRHTLRHSFIALNEFTISTKGEFRRNDANL